MVTINIDPEALQQLDEYDRWWSQNRPSASAQVFDEVLRVMELLAEQPEIGTPYTDDGLKHIRSLRLHAMMPYRIYYHYRPGSDVLTIVYVWSKKRKGRPKIL